MRILHRLLLAALIGGSLTLGGCSGTSTAPLGSTAPSGSTAPVSAAAIVRLLRTVQWPDDEATIKAVFAQLPDTLAGSGVVWRMPDPEASGVAENDGYMVSYGSAGGPTTTLGSGPGIGIISPAHGMASTLIYGGGPQACAEPDHAPIFDDLFALEDQAAMFDEMERIVEMTPTRGELVWLACTRTFAGQPATPAPEADWEHYVYWSQGGWLYSVNAPSDQLRRVGVETFISAVERAGSACRGDGAGQDGAGQDGAGQDGAGQGDGVEECVGS